MINIADSIKPKIYDLVNKRIYEMAQSIQSGLLYEFHNDLIFAGHSKEFDALSSVSVSVDKVQDTEYKLSMDMGKLTDKQKELFEFYFKNAKARVLGGDA